MSPLIFAMKQSDFRCSKRSICIFTKFYFCITCGCLLFVAIVAFSWLSLSPCVGISVPLSLSLSVYFARCQRSAKASAAGAVISFWFWMDFIMHALLPVTKISKYLFALLFAMITYFHLFSVGFAVVVNNRNQPANIMIWRCALCWWNGRNETQFNI